MNTQRRTSIYIVQTARIDESVELDRPVGFARNIADEAEAGSPVEIASQRVR